MVIKILENTTRLTKKGILIFNGHLKMQLSVISGKILGKKVLFYTSSYIFYNQELKKSSICFVLLLKRLYFNLLNFVCLFAVQVGKEMISCC